jgi:hypothetical protein
MILLRVLLGCRGWVAAPAGACTVGAALVHVAPHGGGYLADVATPAGGAQVGECEQVILPVLVEGHGALKRQARLVDVEIALVAAVAGAGDYTFARGAGIARRLAVPCQKVLWVEEVVLDSSGTGSSRRHLSRLSAWLPGYWRS